MAKKKATATGSSTKATARKGAVKRPGATVRQTTATKKRAESVKTAQRPRGTVKKARKSIKGTSGIPRNRTVAAKPKPKAKKPTIGEPRFTRPEAATKANRSAHSAKRIDREARIRELAYRKWEAAGRPISDGHEFWGAAEQEVDGNL